MYVAVVYKRHDDTDPKSHRNCGGWECFLGYTKDEAVAQAQQACDLWNTEYTYPKNADGTTNYSGAAQFRGPYQILVGKLDQEVKRATPELVAFTDGEKF